MVKNGKKKNRDLYKYRQKLNTLQVVGAGDCQVLKSNATRGRGPQKLNTLQVKITTHLHIQQNQEKRKERM